MEATKILDYISHEIADHSKNKYTEVTYNDGSRITAHVFKKDQEDINRSLKTNFWTFRTVHNEFVEIDGGTIKSLRVG
ncbi:putative SAM-dependent methyltransferase [Mucilaginibacter sp. UYP25]|uniref:hypothetical protein n=1 Tax=unclassified Mucilaginibacter TaxID=2617802 RepID=UPI0033974FD1